MSARDIRLVFGPPGTGKTTRLLEMIEHEIEVNKIPTQRIGFVSFSRRAIREARTRFGADSDEEFPYFRTFHSIAFRLCDLRRSDVIQPLHLEALTEISGVPFKKVGAEDAALLWEGALGDQALGVLARSSARQTEPEEEWRQTLVPGLTRDKLRTVIKSYRDFKEESGLWDFSDMIERAQGTLPLDILFVDEAQDTSLAQWNMLRRVLPKSCRLVIAGDDDQCVYGWSGADITMLQRLRANSITVLPVSHRLPVKVKEVAELVAGGIQRRVPKSYASRDEIGSVEWIRDLHQLEVDDSQSVLMLARTNSQLGRFREFCRRAGMVYTLPSGDPSTQLPSIRAAHAFEQFRKGVPIPREDLATLNRFLDTKLPISGATHVWTDFFPEDSSIRERPWYAVMTALPERDREYIRKLRARGISTKSSGMIRIGTVHSVKGSEADTVILSTDVTERVANARLRDPDSEQRVFYVGVTRARQRLVLIRPQTSRHWNVMPLLGAGNPGRRERSIPEGDRPS